MTSFKKMNLVLGAILIATMFAANAHAGCGVLRPSGPTFRSQSWQGSDTFQPGSLLFASDDADAIVGMWHVTFTAEGNNGAPPDNTLIDNAVVVWHSDKTEIMNSGRPAQDGDICMGLWEKRGKCRYKVNHIAWGGNDTTNAPSGIGNPLGATQLVQEVTLNPDGNHYVGTFTLDAYDMSGRVVAHIVGVIKATRITVNTPLESLL